MKTKTNTPTSSTNTLSPEGEVLKLGIDAHDNYYVVVEKVDGSLPKKPRRFDYAGLLAWVKKQCSKYKEVHSCYEAGAFGYKLHRELTALEVSNRVICPVDWSENGKKVKTDRLDATSMVLCLEGYLNGNRRSFTPVRVPTEKEEQKRSISRLRDSLVNDRKSHSNRGRSHGTYHGHKVPTNWWKPRKWAALQESLPEHLLGLLKPTREILLVLDEQIKQLDEAHEAMQDEPLPCGMGAITFQKIEGEAVNWKRFKNRKQVGGYTGLCPSEHTSNQKRIQGSITKHGNPRLRHILIELTWNLIRWNPTYRGIEKWRDELLAPKLTKVRKRKIIVAIARQFAVDWWRVRTGQLTPQDIGLEMKSLPAA